MPSSRETHTRKSFRLLTLGGAALVAPDGTPVAEQRRRVALLVLVAAGGDRGTSRDKLIATLSPDSTTESARHALHQLLYYLRRQVGDDAFLGTDPLRLNPQVVAFDVHEFEGSIARGALAEAAALYRGPFLDGFHLGESAEFEEWASHERLRLAAKYADVLAKRAQEAEGRGEYLAAAERWHELVGLDPLNARWAIGRMRALASAGDRAGALRHGLAYQARVRDELEARPDPSVATLMLELRASYGASYGASAEPLPRDAHARVPGGAPMSAESDAVATAVAPAREGAMEPRSEPSIAPLTRTEDEVARTTPRAGAPRIRRSYGWAAAGVAVITTMTVLMAARRVAPASEVPSLGVVPIVNRAGDSLDYLAEGISTSAMDRLNRSRSIRVITVRPPRADGTTAANSAALGRRVGVSAILSGSLTRERDTVWLTTELRRSKDGARLTGGRFAVTTPRLATIESDLLDSVAVALGLARVERDNRHLRDPEVVATLMRAEYYFGKRDTTSFRKAYALYRGAIDRDGGSAEAYAGLSGLLGAFSHYDMAAAPVAYASARAAARRALDLDPEASQAIANLAHEDGMRFWDWDKGERGLRDAVRLEPWRAVNWMLLGTQMRVVGRFDEALAAYRKARDLDPLSRHYTYQIGHAFACAGEPDSALAMWREAIALGSPYSAAHNASSEVLASVGRYDEAIEQWRTVARESGDSATLRALADAHGKAGYDRTMLRHARAQLAEMMARPRGVYVPAMHLADSHAMLGHTALALDFLEKASEEGDPNVSMIGCRWEYDAMREHPRFQALLRKMHLTPATFGKRPRVASIAVGQVASR